VRAAAGVETSRRYRSASIGYHVTDMTAERGVIERAYAGFNARDLDAVLALLSEDVDWPNLLDGCRAVGREAVRAYWERQVVRDLDGRELSSGRVRHVYAFADGLVRRMDVEDAVVGA
jgi:ketosteroid isomerase-like protein